MCDSEIIDTILIIFENYIEPVLFPNVQKISNITQFLKKMIANVFKN